MTASPLAQTPNDMFNAPIAEADPEIAEILDAELSRQQNGLEMIASENFVPRAVLQAQGSVLTNKYAEGYPGRRYYGGCEQVDKIETIARERAKSLFGAEYANVQPHSGAQANAAVYQALVKPGDTVLGLALDHGGHLTHGMKINFSGRFYHAEAYGVNPETFRIDPEIIRQRALETHPAMIIGGWSAYPRIEDFKAMKEIADEVGAKFWVDMAHFAGLVAAGLHPSPVPYADVVSSTAHKTLGGPRSGFILAKQEYAKKLNSAVFPGQQGGPLMHVIAGKAVAFKVAATPEFKDRMQRTLDGAKILAERLMADDVKNNGISVLTGGTDVHLVMVATYATAKWTANKAKTCSHNAASPSTATPSRSTHAPHPWPPACASAPAHSPPAASDPRNTRKSPTSSAPLSPQDRTSTSTRSRRASTSLPKTSRFTRDSTKSTDHQPRLTKSRPAAQPTTRKWPSLPSEA